MASSYASSNVFLLLSICLAFCTIAMGGNFHTDFDILFGDKRANIQDGGMRMYLAMDNSSGSGIVSKNEYLFGRFDMQIKLVPGNSAGTVTAYYVCMHLSQTLHIEMFIIILSLYICIHATQLHTAYIYREYYLLFHINTTKLSRTTPR